MSHVNDKVSPAFAFIGEPKFIDKDVPCSTEAPMAPLVTLSVKLYTAEVVVLPVPKLSLSVKLGAVNGPGFITTTSLSTKSLPYI